MEFNRIGILIVIAIGLIVGLVLLSDNIADNTTGTSLRTNVSNESVSISALRTTAGAYDINTSRFVNLTYGHPQGATGDNAWRKSAGSECYIDNIVITNSTGTYTFVENTDYVVNYSSPAWDLKFLNTTVLGNASGTQQYDNTTYVTYDYCGPNYVAGTANQTMLELVVIFCAVALVVFAAWPAIKDFMGLD